MKSPLYYAKMFLFTFSKRPDSGFPVLAQELQPGNGIVYYASDICNVPLLFRAKRRQPAVVLHEPCFYRASSGPNLAFTELRADRTFFYRTPNGPSFNCMNFRVAFLHQNLCFLGVAKIRIKIWKFFELLARDGK